MAVVEKKIKARKRQQEVADEYRKWLKKHPKAGRVNQVKMFDAISDSAFLRDKLENSG